MNPNEIKKALECCTQPTTDCDNCPYTMNDDCFDIVKLDALAYINQLEAENKAFGKIIKKQDDEISVLRKDLLKRQNLEENFSKVKKQFDKKMLKHVKFERADAIKEFAQRLKSNFAVIKYISLVLYERIIQIIDNLVKEMVGDDVATK